MRNIFPYANKVCRNDDCRGKYPTFYRNYFLYIQCPTCKDTYFFPEVLHLKKIEFVEKMKENLKERIRGFLGIEHETREIKKDILAIMEKQMNFEKQYPVEDLDAIKDVSFPTREKRNEQARRD